MTGLRKWAIAAAVGVMTVALPASFSFAGTHAAGATRTAAAGKGHRGKHGHHGHHKGGGKGHHGGKKA
jgi:hypothetical protein